MYVYEGKKAQIDDNIMNKNGTNLQIDILLKLREQECLEQLYDTRFEKFRNEIISKKIFPKRKYQAKRFYW